MTGLLTPHPSPLLSAAPGWVPFVTPPPIWDYWPLLLVPLLAGIAVAYKATKAPRRSRLAAESLKLFAYLAGVLLLAGAVLIVVVQAVVD